MSVRLHNWKTQLKAEKSIRYTTLRASRERIELLQEAKQP